MFVRSLCVALLLSWTAAAEAQVTYFGQDDSNLDLTNSNAARNSFVASLGSFYEETYEGIGGEFNPTIFVGTPYQANTTFAQVVSFGPLAVSPTKLLLEIGPQGPNDPVFFDSMTFAQPITAFGTYIAQAGDGDANEITLRLENTLLDSSKDVIVGTIGPQAPFGNVLFFGVTDTAPFNKVTLIESFDYDGILLDNTIVGVVPEPSTGCLSLLGLTVLLRGRRRARG